MVCSELCLNVWHHNWMRTRKPGMSNSFGAMGHVYALTFYAVCTTLHIMMQLIFHCYLFIVLRLDQTWHPLPLTSMLISGTKDFAVTTFDIELRCTSINWDRNRSFFKSSKSTVVRRHKYSISKARQGLWCQFIYLGGRFVQYIDKMFCCQHFQMYSFKSTMLL